MQRKKTCREKANMKCFQNRLLMSRLINNFVWFYGENDLMTKILIMVIFV